VISVIISKLVSCYSYFSFVFAKFTLDFLFVAKFHRIIDIWLGFSVLLNFIVIGHALYYNLSFKFS
jgi:hypothetical protein